MKIHLVVNEIITLGHPISIMNELVLQLEEDTVASSAASSVGGRGTPFQGPRVPLSNTQK